MSQDGLSRFKSSEARASYYYGSMFLAVGIARSVPAVMVATQGV